MGFSTALSSIPAEELKRLKRDRRYLEIALEEAGRLLHGVPTQISGDSCSCPFHRDEHPSGSLHQGFSGNGTGDWIYTCHGCPDRGGEWNDLNPQKPSNSGDAIAVLCVASKRAGQEMGFSEACQYLLDAFERRYGKQVPSAPTTPSSPVPGRPDPNKLARAEQEMEEAQAQLLGSPDLLQRLCNERAVAKDVAARLGVGFISGEPGRNYWVFPITDAQGRFLVQKRHAADGQKPKAQWWPPKAKSGDPLYPVDLQHDGPVWLCPGELKALAVISLGLPAIGLTSGEGPKQLPNDAVGLLRGRQVAIVPDNDETGREWADAVRNQLVASGIDVRLVDLGFTEEGEDIGDWLVRRRVKEGRNTASVKGELTRAYESAAPGASPTVDGAAQPAGSSAQVVSTSSGVDCPIRTVDEIWADEATWAPVERIRTHIPPLDDVLDGGFRTRGVHLVAGKAGHAKTQLACQIAVNVARPGVPVGFVSLEMDGSDVGRLVLAQLSGVQRTIIDGGLANIRNRDLADDVTCALEAFHDSPLGIVDGQGFAGGFTREHLEKVVAEGVQERGWKVIFLDHLGELAPLDNDPVAQPLHIDKANAAVLRALARRYDVALVAVAPLRKGANYKTPKKGEFVLDDVMGSAAIGYNVHTCIAVTAKYQPRSAKGEVQLHILKNRNGPTPEEPVVLSWQAACGQVFAPRKSATPTAAEVQRTLPDAADTKMEKTT